MKDLKEYDISFTGLKLGKHQFSYKIDNTFFDFFQYQEFDKVNIKVDIIFEKKNTMFNLEFISKGFVMVACDLTGESFELDVNGSLSLIVNFGETFNGDNEEVLIIPHNSYQLNVGQYIYEMIALSIPTKRVHPGIADGTLDSEVLNRLRNFERKKIEENKTIDPRWAKLKELRTNKKE